MFTQHYRITKLGYNNIKFLDIQDIMKQNKFIIFDDELIFGQVEFHLQLLPKNVKVTDNRLHGGGMFHISKDVITLFGASVDFGKFDYQITKNYFKSNRYTGNETLCWCIRGTLNEDIRQFKFQIMTETHEVIELNSTRLIDE